MEEFSSHFHWLFRDRSLKDEDKCSNFCLLIPSIRNEMNRTGWIDNDSNLNFDYPISLINLIDLHFLFFDVCLLGHRQWSQFDSVFNIDIPNMMLYCCCIRRPQWELTSINCRNYAGEPHQHGHKLCNIVLCNSPSLLVYWYKSHLMRLTISRLELNYIPIHCINKARHNSATIVANTGKLMALVETFLVIVHIGTI